MDDYELNPDYWNADGSPIDSGSSNDVTSGTGGSPTWLNSLFTSSGNVLTQALKNQSTAAQQKLAAKLGVAQQANSNNTLKIVIIAVVGLIGVGLAFAFLKPRKG